jgi:hypothetical protein
MPLYRSKLTNVYHECMRCGTRQPLSRMSWQDGKLMCKANNCVDTAVVGTRDLAVAKAVSIDRHELHPDRKLTTPSDRRNDGGPEVLF